MSSSNSSTVGIGGVVGVKPAGARELTLRAVLVSIVVAAIIASSYPYVVLKLGFGPNISVVSAFLGFLALGLVFRNFNRWENNLIETAGTAAGQTAFLCTLMVAFDLLSFDEALGIDISLSPLQSFIWLSLAGCLGVLLAVPMRQHYVVDEKLPFPDGIAAAQTMIVLDSRGPQARLSALAMVLAALVSAARFVAANLHRLFEGGKSIAEEVHFSFVPHFQKVGAGLELGWLSLGSGMIVGLRVTLSMIVGGILAWCITPSYLVEHAILKEGWKRNDVLLWVMWPATGMLTAGGLTALFLKWKVLRRTFQQLTGPTSDARDFPLRWVAIGVPVLAVGLIAFQHYSLGQAWWQTALAIVLSLPLMLVGLRVLGETNWGPISALSNLMQGVFGMIKPGDISANMVASGVTGSVCAESEGLMQDYKAGHILGTTPRYLTYIQLMAIPVGALAVSLIYPLLRPEVQAGTLTSPISKKWEGFAKILAGGVEAVPQSAFVALIVFTLLGILLTVLEQKAELRRLLPSPTGMGIGMLVPFSVVATMALGGIVGEIWQRSSPQTAEKYLIPLASGFIAGEALLGTVFAGLAAAGLLHG
ncbi:MAG: OPT family oligopeptide transporter [Planctomycetes bacterium]|nr:OPT family oligopeptide transporter [Planctomycetota bacterium]